MLPELGELLPRLGESAQSRRACNSYKSLHTNILPESKSESVDSKREVMKASVKRREETSGDKIRMTHRMVGMMTRKNLGPRISTEEKKV